MNEPYQRPPLKEIAQVFAWVIFGLVFYLVVID